jgi:hypothetical protein
MDDFKAFFWLVHRSLAAILLMALTIYFIVMLIEGRIRPDEWWRLLPPG